ncbi:MAG: hypothetical protein DLM57_00460 [Pseudonocardiales bacterium]|nr:MAG: hypothetical protein DLM57_00460 [Pseudonocardiales bacterium]
MRFRSLDRLEIAARCEPPAPSWSCLDAAGFTTKHVADVGRGDADDQTIFDFAAAEQFVVITADSDFTMLLAARRSATPSVVLLRHVAELRSDSRRTARCQPAVGARGAGVTSRQPADSTQHDGGR